MTNAHVLISGCNRPIPYFASSNAAGISLYGVDFATQTADLKSTLPDIENPVFMAVHPTLPRIYATSEMPLLPEGSVTAIDVSDDKQGLRALPMQSSAGSITAHLSIDKNHQYLLATNHGWEDDLGGRDQAIAIIRLDEETGLGRLTASAKQSGSGSQLPRQKRSHPHAALVTPSNRFVIVTDLGADALIVYRFDDIQGTIEPAHSIDLALGTGPRHFTFSHNGTRIHVCGELDSSVTSLEMQTETGALTIIGKCSTVMPGYKGQNYPSEIALSPTGSQCYVANRGDDSIARIAIDTADKTPVFLDTVKSQGRTPRHFAIDPSGRYMLVANQDSDRVNCFEIGEDDALTPINFSIETGTPTCVAFYD